MVKKRAYCLRQYAPTLCVCIYPCKVSMLFYYTLYRMKFQDVKR